MAAAADVPGRFVAAAAMVRHLLTDPVLPDELLPRRLARAPRCGTPMHEFAAELVGATKPNPN